MPILIRQKSQDSLLRPRIFANEEELERLLAQNPDLLLGDLLSGDGESPGIVLVDRQINLPETGRLDLLFVTREGLPIAVEVKLARNGESRREVVAQAIDYLSSITALTVDELDARVDGRLSTALHRLTSDDESFEVIWTAIGTKLRAGEARLVVVLDETRPELERIFHFLARNSKLDVQLFTVKPYSSTNGDEVFVPRILVNPESEDDGGTRSSSPPSKSFKELLGGCANQAVIDFFSDRLEQSPPPRTNSKGNELVYPSTGTIRWYVAVRKLDARVNQIGRFQKDKDLWQHLSDPSFSDVTGGGKENLKFSLVTPEDILFFQSQMARGPSVFKWEKQTDGIQKGILDFSDRD